jgi:hypothetical protein
MPTIVNGEQIEDAEVRQEAKLIYERLMEERAPNESPLTINLRASEWALENVIERTLLRQAALKDAEPIAPEVLEVAIDQIQSQSPGRSGCVLPGSEQAYRRQVEVNLCIERLIGKLTERIARPKHKEVIEYYQKNRGAFYVPELVHAAHIVKNVGPEVDEEAGRAAIANAHAELQNGRSFEEVADEFSDCPGRGGDLGFFPRGQMVEEFENVVFALQPGQVSGIFRTPFGFHIAKLYEKKPEGHRPFPEVRGEIEQALHNQKKDQAVGHFVDELRVSAEIRKTRVQPNNEAQR